MTTNSQLLVIVDRSNTLEVDRADDGRLIITIDNPYDGSVSIWLTNEQAAKVAKALSDETP
jgi:hypothetical protein